MLSPQSIEKIEYELTKYPANQRQAAVMSALRIVQTERGWLSQESITEGIWETAVPEISVELGFKFSRSWRPSGPGKPPPGGHGAGSGGLPPGASVAALGGWPSTTARKEMWE